MTGTRDGAIARAEKYFDDGGFLAELQRRVAIPTTSQEKDHQRDRLIRFLPHHGKRSIRLVLRQQRLGKVRASPQKIRFQLEQLSIQDFGFGETTRAVIRKSEIPDHIGIQRITNERRAKLLLRIARTAERRGESPGGHQSTRIRRINGKARRPSASAAGQSQSKDIYAHCRRA